MMRATVTELLKKTHKSRFGGALSFIFQSGPITVTRESVLEISGPIIGTDDTVYGCHIDRDGYFCGCMDNFARKLICKHIIALVLRAFHDEMISELDLMSVLVWRKEPYYLTPDEAFWLDPAEYKKLRKERDVILTE